MFGGLQRKKSNQTFLFRACFKILYCVAVKQWPACSISPSGEVVAFQEISPDNTNGCLRPFREADQHAPRNQRKERKTRIAAKFVVGVSVFLLLLVIPHLVSWIAQSRLRCCSVLLLLSFLLFVHSPSPHLTSRVSSVRSSFPFPLPGSVGGFFSGAEGG